MSRTRTTLPLFLVLGMVACGRPAEHAGRAAPASVDGRSWTEKSNAALQPYIDLLKATRPEQASSFGYEDCDDRISDISPGFRDRRRAARRAARTELERRRAQESDPVVAQDLDIAIRLLDLILRTNDVSDRLMLPEWDASLEIFGALRSLLDDRCDGGLPGAAVTPRSRPPHKGGGREMVSRGSYYPARDRGTL
jgi:hypothetical protein